MKTNEYIIETQKIKDTKNIVVVSDLHINDKINTKKINKILEIVDSIKPTHIVMPGDLYNPSIKTLNSNNIYKFIDELSYIAKILYVKGDMEGGHEDLPKYLEEIDNFIPFWEMTDKGLYTMYEENDISFTGIRLPKYFYEMNNKDKLINIEFFYSKYLINVIDNMKKDNYKVLLCHDPIIKNIIEKLNLDFDLVISGHNHGGMGPKVLKPLLKHTKLDMEKLYPNYVKGLIPCGEGKMLISEGITKYHTGKLKLLEPFHESQIDKIKIKSK